MNNTIIYELKGTERIESMTHKVPCGDLITTSYFDVDTNRLVRQDINVVVDEEFLLGAIQGE